MWCGKYRPKRALLHYTKELNNIPLFFILCIFLFILSIHGLCYSFCTGILPPIFAETPKRAIKFFCFGSYNAYLSRNTSLSNPMCGSIAEFEKIKLQNFTEKIHKTFFPICFHFIKMFSFFLIVSNFGTYLKTLFFRTLMNSGSGFWPY